MPGNQKKVKLLHIYYLTVISNLRYLCEVLSVQNKRFLNFFHCFVYGKLAHSQRDGKCEYYLRK
jgi:hypothetical protein